MGEGGEAGLEKLPCFCSGEEGILRKKSGRASFVWFFFSGSKSVHVGFCLFVMRMFSENEIWVLILSHFIACKIRLIIISCFLNFLSERSFGFQLGCLLYVYLWWGVQSLETLFSASTTRRIYHPSVCLLYFLALHGTDIVWEKKISMQLWRRRFVW